MTDFLKNTVSIRDLVFLATVVVTFAIHYTTTEQRLTALEKSFDQRASEADKALDLLHSIDVRIEAHVAEHRGRGQ